MLQKCCTTNEVDGQIPSPLNFMGVLTFIAAVVGGILFALPTSLLTTAVRLWLDRRVPATRKSSSWKILGTAFCWCFLTGTVLVLIYAAIYPPRRL